MATTKKTTKRTTKGAQSRGNKRSQGKTSPKAPTTKPNGKTPTKGPGVIASIVEFLSAASSRKPLTKQDLCDKLVKRFPKRESTALMRTINCQVPTRLVSEKELDVQKNDKKPAGYWIK